MNQINATEFNAKYPTLEKYADINDISMAKVMRLCGYQSGRSPKHYKLHRVVFNSNGDMSLQTEKTIRAII